MKWESLLLTALAAGSATARAHGLHQAAHHHQKKDANPVVETVWTTKTVVDWDIVTVYHTVTVDSTATTTSTTTTTVSVVEASTETSTSTATSTASTSDSVVVESAAVSLKEDLVVENTSTTETSSSTTVATSEATTTTTITPATSSTAASTSSSAASSSSSSSSSSSDWSSTPSDGTYSTSGFGDRTTSSGSGVSYTGNVGSPWGSNIIEVDSSSASSYKYVVQLTSSASSAWFVSFWNKVGPDGKLDGWYGNSALNFSLAAGETRYVAFDEDSQGAWGAAEGDSLPTDEYGGYACTWGEFDFGDTANDGWSGWDVSAIQAQNADLTVQGMRICTAAGADCSTITTGAASVVNAYTAAEASIDGIGGSVSDGAVRLAVEIDYSE